MTQTQKQNVPKLRFPGFEGAWEEKRLGDALTIASGRDYKHLCAGDVPVYGTGGLMTYVDEFLYDGESVCIGRKGTINKPVLLNGKFWTVDTLFYTHSFRDSLPRFVYALFQQINWKVHNEASGVPSLSKATIEKLKVNLPTLPEQHKIAGFLSAVDTKIAHLSRKKALLEDYKKGCMQQLFSQKIRFKDDDGNDFPDWEEKRLEQVANINPKSGPLPETFLYIDLESVSQGQLTDPKQETSATAPSRAQRPLSANDTLFQLVRPYQRNNYFFPGGEIHVASTGYAVLRARESPKFLYQAVHEDRFVNRVLERCTGTNYPAINSNDLAKIQLTVPHPAEQRKIADFLSALDRKIDLVAQELTHARSFKAGLLQQMFI